MNTKYSGFTLVEILIGTAIVLSLLVISVELGRYFLAGFISGEEKFGELRESGTLLDYLREDLDDMVPDLTRSDLGLVVAGGGSAVSLTRSFNGNPANVTYQYLTGQGQVSRQVVGQSPMLIGSGLIQNCVFTRGCLCRVESAGVGSLSACSSSGAPVSPMRLYLTVNLQVSPPASPAPLAASSANPWLIFSTNIFPIWANRRISSIWNR